MKRVLALFWLLLTLAPIAYIFFFVFFSFSMLATGAHSFQQTKEQFDFIFMLQMIAILGSWALVASYVVYLFRSSYVPQEKRALWAVVLFLGNMIAMPIFWYLYVWRPLQSESTGA